MTVILTPLLSISVANPPSNINNLPSSKFIIKHSVRGGGVGNHSHTCSMTIVLDTDLSIKYVY